MKYIKTYENINEPKVGDYAVVKLPNYDSSISRLLEIEIGKIKKTFLPTKTEGWSYLITFGTIDFLVKRKEIVDFSESKEKLEPYIQQLKYNL
jgi:hypothetical protein